MSQRPESQGSHANTNLDKNNSNINGLKNSPLQADVRVDDTAANGQPVSIKSWLQKLLVIALCAMSFYAGWQANQSNIVRHCLESGGRMDAEAPVLSCQWP